MPASRRAETARPPQSEQKIEEMIELQNKVEALDSAMSSILIDAANTPLTKAEQQAITGWSKKGGGVSDWPIDDGVTPENYKNLLSKYGIADFIDPELIQPNDSQYSAVARQHKLDKIRLSKLKTTKSPPSLRVIGGGTNSVPEHPKPPHSIETPPPKSSETKEPTQPPESPESPQPPTGEGGGKGGEPPEPPETETKMAWEIEDPEKVEQIRKSWKVWEMTFALLHAMQKYPDKFKELQRLSDKEREKKLAEEGPRLVQEYMTLATRGQMAWNKTKEMWAPHPSREANMDVKMSLLLFKRAGFKVEVSEDETANVEMTAPGGEGAANPFVLQFDTMDTAKRDRLERENKLAHMQIETAGDGNLKEGEYRVTVDHHTSDPSERITCSAQLIYDYFLASGLIEQDPVMERLLEFTTEHDNGRSPEGEKFYRRSAKTLWGIAGDTRVPAEVIYKIIERGREPEDELSDEDLQEALPSPDRNGPKTVGELVKNKENNIKRSIKSFNWWRDQGYVIETDYGPMWISLAVEGRYMPRQLVDKAFGVPNTLIWQPEEHSFFISLGGKKSFAPETKLPQGEMIREHMAIYKRQKRTPEKLTASLAEILEELTKTTPLNPGGDLRAFLIQEPSRFATVQTLFYIYYNNLDKKQTVIEELAKRNQAIKQLENARNSMSYPPTKLKYQEIIDRVRKELGLSKKRKRKRKA